MKTKKIWPMLLAAVAVLAAGCGGGKDTASANATDAAFITDMSSHHRGAIDMAQLAQSRADHPQLRRLADSIVAAQQAEISLMKRIGDDMRGSEMHDGGHMGMSQSQMGMDLDMPKLKRADPFDRAFIDMMVPHHEGAIAMARKELADGTHPGLRKMAQGIIDAQTAEIARMRAWRNAWYGSAAGSGGHGAMQH